MIKTEKVYLWTAVNSACFFSSVVPWVWYFCCREAVVSKNVDILSGEVTVNLNEELVFSKKFTSDAFSHAAEVTSSTAKESQIKQAALLSLKKCISVIPEKVSMSKLWIHTIFFFFIFYPSILTYSCYILLL